MTHNHLPHLIALRYVGIDEGLTEDHAQPSELRTFNNTDRLRDIRERMDEYETKETYLIIRDDEASEVIHKRRGRKRWYVGVA